MTRLSAARLAEIERQLRPRSGGGDPAEPPADRFEHSDALELAELDLRTLDGNGLYAAGSALQDALTTALRDSREARATAAELLAEVKRQSGRGDALEASLRDLVAWVKRTGGYASPEEQDVLRAAERALAGGP